MNSSIFLESELINFFNLKYAESFFEFFNMINEYERLTYIANIMNEAQYYCSFNIFLALNYSQYIKIRFETFEFIAKNKSELKRKLTLKEVAALDFNIRYLQPTNFNDLKLKLKNEKSIHSTP